MIQPGNYKHFKGRHYKVLHLARHSETMEAMVVYQQLYDDFSVWVRPASMFEEMVMHEGRIVLRFQRQEEKDNEAI